MRKRFKQQTELGALPINEVEIDKRSRHELPPTLLALQYIFVTEDLNENIFALLEEKIVKGKKRTGRYGMDLWEILVLGLTRMTLNIDYDHLTDMANNHKALRGILGVQSTVWGKEKSYKLQTIKDNVKLLDEATILKVNDLVVLGCHELKKKDGDKATSNLSVKADSFVVESKIHFPTDLNLLRDSGLMCIRLINNLKSSGHDLKGWYQINKLHNKFVLAYRKSSEIHRKKGKHYKTRLKEATSLYLQRSEKILDKLEKTLLVYSEEPNKERTYGEKAQKWFAQLAYSCKMIIKFMDLVNRRILQEEVIPSSEKIYSIHEPHVEWNSKGKLHRAVELGHNVAIATDQYGLILYAKVYEKEVDKQQTLIIGKTIAEQYSTGNEKLRSISFDRGFYSKPAKEALKKLYKNVVLPKPGKKNQAELTDESQPAFKKYQKAHSIVEANINMLEHHGLDICPDKGIEGFKRYVAYGVLACNLHMMGKFLIAIEKKKEIKRKKIKKSARAA